MVCIGFRLNDVRRALARSVDEIADFATAGARRNQSQVGRFLVLHGIACGSIAIGFRRHG